MKTAKTITREKLSGLLDGLAEKYRLFAPVMNDNIVTFAEVKKGSEVALEFTNSREPPKKIFFPQSETLFSYSKEGNRHVPEQMEKKTVVFGMRPCDAKALSLLDNVFNSPDYQDPYYVEKRHNTIIVTLACNNPQISCFCTSFDLGPFSKTGSDVFVVNLGEKFLLEAVTEKGDALLQEISELNKAEEKEIQQAKELQTVSENKIKRRIQTNGIAEKLDGMFDHPLWDEIHEKCLCCGVCSFLCPTCHCFDINDEALDGNGQRVRTWDCCMFPDFTLEASGHNPRPTGRERMRQRIMHKFNYFVKNYGQFACVGCGRCLRNCPVSTDIIKVIEAINSAK